MWRKFGETPETLRRILTPELGLGLAAPVVLFLGGVAVFRASPQLWRLFHVVFLLWIVAWTVVDRAVPGRARLGPMLALGLSGGGLLTLLPLAPFLALKQALVLFGGIVLAALGRRVLASPRLVQGLQTGFWVSLLLVGLTPFLGRSAYPHGPRLWLGCCGLYLETASLHKPLFLAWLALQGERPAGWPLALGLVGTLLFVALQGDLGTLLLYMLLAWVMLGRRSQWRRARLYGLFPVLLAAAGLGYRYRARIAARFVAWLLPHTDPLGRGYQLLQAQTALCRGGWWGNLPLKAAARVPLAATDLFYALLAEAWGWLGALLVFALLAWLLLWTRQSQGARWVQDMAHGLAWWWGSQAFTVAAGGLRLLPLTGMPFPFMAYGGSELTAMYLGLLLLSWLRQGPRRPSLSRTDALWLLPFGLLLLAHGLWLGLGCGGR